MADFEDGVGIGIDYDLIRIESVQMMIIERYGYNVVDFISSNII